MWNRLKSFWGLPAADQVLFLRAAVWLAAFRTALVVLPFRHPWSWVQHRAANPAEVAEDRVAPARIGWAVSTAGRYIPGAVCLAQAMAAAVLLSRAGHKSTVSIGIAKSSNVGLEAHAWVECDGEIIVGGEEAGKFTPLGRSRS